MLTRTLTHVPLQDGGLLRTQAHIGGQWLDADDGATLEVSNPATGWSASRTIWQIQRSGSAARSSSKNRRG